MSLKQTTKLIATNHRDLYIQTQFLYYLVFHVSWENLLKSWVGVIIIRPSKLRGRGDIRLKGVKKLRSDVSGG